jgi:hypothetical protein
MSMNVTSAPCRAKASTMPAPMPDPPPVISTLLLRRLG